MFGIPGKQAVSITPAAAKQISRLMAKDEVQGLRIGVKKGGCAGMEYTMDYAAEIDYETSLLEAGFKFRNPNVADACGCGESIKFKDVDELAAERTKS